MNKDEIVARLIGMRDVKYAALQAKVIPAMDPERIIGVRTPELRAFAKELFTDSGRDSFLADLPHHYFEENQLHAFILSLEKDFDRCAAEMKAFLPYVDNWATCDQMSPKTFKKEPERLLPLIREWIASDRTYTVRFAIGMLMQHYLDGAFKPEYAEMVAAVRSEAYYINMMRAWYFATALAKQQDRILPFLEEKRLDAWTHNKAIQKSIESYRIPDELKQYLRTLRV